MKKNYFLPLFLMATFSATSQNLVANGGFEEFIDEAWSIIDDGVTVTQQNVYKSEGSSAGQFKLTTATQSNTDFRQVLDVFAGIEYNISVDVYHVSGDNDGRARIFIEGAGNNGFGTYSDPSIVDQWQTITMTYTATSNAPVEFGFRFYDVAGFDGSSVMYIDNIEVIDATLTVDTPEKLNFSLYPNPTTTGFVSVNTTSKEEVFVSVYNVLGKKVISETLKNNRLDVSKLNSGIYILNIANNTTSVSKKLVIK